MEALGLEAHLKVLVCQRQQNFPRLFLFLFYLCILFYFIFKAGSVSELNYFSIHAPALCRILK